MFELFYRPTDGDILRVLVNNSAQIKCDVGSSLPDDKVLLVVWYKNNLPIYRWVEGMSWLVV